MKYCEDCRWCKGGNPEFYKCVAPQNRKINWCFSSAVARNWKPRPEPKYIYCSTQRTGGLIGGLITLSCGNGRWFEPRKP